MYHTLVINGANECSCSYVRTYRTSSYISPILLEAISPQSFLCCIVLLCVYVFLNISIWQRRQNFVFSIIKLRPPLLHRTVIVVNVVWLLVYFLFLSIVLCCCLFYGFSLGFLMFMSLLEHIVLCICICIYKYYICRYTNISRCVCTYVPANYESVNLCFI